MELSYSSLLSDGIMFYQIAIVFYAISILLMSILLTKKSLDPKPKSTSTIFGKLNNPIFTKVMPRAIKLRNRDKSPRNQTVE